MTYRPNLVICRVRCWLAFLSVICGLASLAMAQVQVPLTIQEAIYPGAPTAGLNRTQDPVTVGIPLPDSAGINNINQLGLSGASVGQFRVLGRWPSGNIKWVLVDTQADVPAGGQNQSITLTTGTGNFGGSNLATDNGSNITVNTGVAQFTIRKAAFNLFDQVVVNGKTLVASGSSAGLVLMGPSSGTSCGTCTDAYTSRNDPNSTAVIEENGPARAVVKADGSHVDAAGHAYMHYTVRMHFYKGKAYAKVEVILRNADETNSTAGDVNSAFKGFASYEARVTPALGSSRSFSIGTDSNTAAAGSFTGSESAYLYQAYSNNMEVQDWNAPNCVPGPINDRCVASYIARTPNTDGSYTYAQDGYQIVHGLNVLASGDHTKYPQGWADLSDSSGAGMDVGVYQMSAYWPKSLQFVNGGAETRVGIWPDQSLFTSGGGQPYYQGWPAYSVHDIFFEFHDTALASPAQDFLRFQHFLLARAPRSQYNNAGVFPYPLIDPVAEDVYYRSLNVECCLRDVGPKIFRRYDWYGGGAGNQHELRWSYLRNFLQRGLTGRYLFAAHFYRMLTELGFPRSDGFAWRDHALSQLNYEGFPENISSANGGLATRNWIDGQHAHWYGMADYYYMSGDETIKDQLLDGVKDDFLNAGTPVNTGHMGEARDIGERLMGIAHLYQFLSSIGDPDAAALLPIADNILNLQVFPELPVSGYGTGDPSVGGAQGVSRTRGMQYGCCESDSHDGLSGRAAAPFRSAILVEGLVEAARAFGPAWHNYNLTTDLAYGVSEWALHEGYGSPPGQTPTPMNSGWIYEIFLDQPNAGSSWYQAPGDSQTTWMHFYVPAFYAGDTSWRQKFEWFLERSATVNSLSIFAEYGSHMVQAVVDKILNPPTVQLVTVPLTVRNNGGGSYTLSWTVPAGAISYRIKDVAGKSIVDWIGFNPGTNTFTGDPTTTWPWYASADVPNIPPPAGAGTTQTFTVTGLDPAQTFHFALKAYVTNGGSSGDTTPPTVSITSPASGATVSGAITVTAAASDNVAVAGVQFEVDGHEIGTPLTTSPYSLPLNTTTLSNGSHTLTAMAVDSAGNSAQASVTFTVNNTSAGDTTPPTVTMTSPAAGTSVTGTITVSANATDDGAVASVVFQVDGHQIGSVTTLPYQVSLNTVTLSNGAHTIAAIATDAAGNSAQAQVTVTVSNNGAPPGGTISITAPQAGTTISGSVVITATTSQPVTSVQWQIDGANLGSPLLTAPYSASWNTATVSNGPHTVTAVANTSSGPLSASITVQVLNSTGAPVTTPATGGVSTASIDGNTKFVVDLQDLWSLFGCATCSFQTANDLIPGQTAEVVLRQGTVNRVADQVVLRQGTLNGTVASVQSGRFTLQMSSNGLLPGNVLVLTSGLTEFLNRGSGLQPGQAVAVRGLLFRTGPEGIPTEIAKRVEVRAASSGSSGGGSGGGSGDTIPPTVAITSPVSGASVSGTVTVSATASDDVAVASVAFEVDGRPSGTPVVNAPYIFSLNTLQLTNGSHTVTALATDLAGNTAQAVVTVNVNNSGPPDTTPPTVSIASPAAGATVSGTVTVTANASDNVAVAGVVFEADGQRLGSAASAPYSATWNTLQVPNGTHTLTAVATDTAGNSAQASITVNVGNTSTPPTITLSPSTLTFASQVVATASRAETVTLGNSGTSAMTLTGVSATGDFAETNNCGASIAAGASCTISVTFTPTTTGTRTGVLTVASNAVNSPQTVPLTGTGVVNGGSCPSNQWCQIVPTSTFSGIPDNGWDQIIFSHDTGKFYLYANNGTDPTVTPWENAFWSYTVQGQPAAANPWVEVSDCGDTGNTVDREQRLFLANAIGATDTQLTLGIGGGDLHDPNFPQSGTIWLEDEAISFNGCTSVGGSGTCQTGATSLTLTNLRRGARQAAGYLPAGSHAAGAPTNLACPAPTLNGAATTDHPPSRHPVGGTTYDSKRGRIWETWGYQEMWTPQDTWYLCVFPSASCSASQMNAGWQRLPLFSTGGEEAPSYLENAVVYDPDNDAIVEFGGVNGGTASADVYIFCFNTNAYGCTATNKWLRVTPHGGNPGARDAARMVYDTWNHRVLVFGGVGPNNLLWNSVAIYNTATGDWCLSDTSQGGSNATSCSLPAVSGTAPAGTRFPSWTFDNTRGKAAYYGGPGALYTYDAAQNQWHLTSVTGGPVLPSIYLAGTSWAYDDVHDTYVYVSGGNPTGFQTWELPGSALGH